MTRYDRFWTGLLMCSLALGAAGCVDEVDAAKEIAESCGDQVCPAGTSPSLISELKAGTDITGGFDPATYEADAAFVRFGEGRCEFACQVINPCPCPSEVQCTFPVITQTCFTCGTLNAEGQVQQGSCADIE